jgi:hypothetical protein
MKCLPILFAATTLLMASCTSTVAGRIEHNPEIYTALSARHKELVQQGQIEEGMTKKAVFIAWGRPDRASRGSKSGKAFEKWSYTGYDPTYTPGFAYGAGYWGRGYRGCHYDRSFLYEPMLMYVPYEEARVEFLDGTVSAWSTSR